MENLFKSFFMGGFECADHLNSFGNRVNLLKETEHDVRIKEDYKLLSVIGIKVVREGICWSEVEISEGVYNFAEIYDRIKIAEKLGIQQIWDLIHFGYPNDLYPTHPKFCERFKNLCTAFARFHKLHSFNKLYVIPINEISFLSWMSGDVRGTAPYAVNSGWDIKYHLSKAAIIGINALKEVLPDCIIISSEPLVKIHGDGIISKEELAEINSYQYQAMDIVTGKICPELGGDKTLIDVMGLNYYWTCQWRINSGTLDWPDLHNNRTPFSSLMEELYERYKIPLLITETGHFGVGRIPWMKEIINHCDKAIERNIPIYGICIYPVVDRPEWDFLDKYNNCGLYDLDDSKNRIPHIGYINFIKQQVQLFEQYIIAL
ncbi:MAG: hypothetical protein ITF98_10655 [Fermentimonas sp.]|nr:hypothetical protein [Fermentimonas sp.]